MKRNKQQEGSFKMRNISSKFLNRFRLLGFISTKQKDQFMKLFAIILLFISQSLFGQIMDHEKVLKLLQLAGDENVAQDISTLYISPKDFIVSDLTEENSEAISELLWSSFNDSIITQNILNTFDNKFNQEHYDACLKYFHSPLFVRLNQAEINSERPEAEAEMDEFMENVKISKDREKVINELMTKTGILSALWESSYSRPIMVQLLAKKIVLSNNEPTMAEIEKFVAEYQKKNLRNIQLYMFAQHLFTYREFSDNEINDYKNFIQSEAGQWYHNNILEGSRISFIKFIEKQ